MAAGIGEVGRDGVDSVEGIEQAHGRAGAGIGRCSDLEKAVVEAADAVGRKGRARDVTSKALELPGILRGERFSFEHLPRDPMSLASLFQPCAERSHVVTFPGKVFLDHPIEV